VNPTAPPGGALVHKPAGASPARNAFDEVRFQKLWLATQKRHWRSLAIIGASEAMETLEVADMLAKIAWWYRGEPSCVIDLRDASLRLVEFQVQELMSQVQAGQRVIVALRSTIENPTAVPLARAADAVILCVKLGETALKVAEKTIDEIGRDRVLGCIVVKTPEHKALPAAPAKNGGGKK
jgi:hypothetical protein